MGKKLVTINEVRQRMFLPDIDGIRTAIGETLEGTTEQLESELRTKFTLTTGLIDLFYVADANLDGGRFHRRFLLKRGLVDEGTNALKIEVAPKRIEFLPGSTSGSVPLDLRDVAASAVVDDADQFVIVEAERGIVTVQDFRLLRQHVQITYDAGIAPDPNISDQFLQTGTNSVPDFLKELALAWTMLELTTSPQVGIEQKELTTGKAVRPAFLERKIERLLTDHIRYQPDAIKPLDF